MSDPKQTQTTLLPRLFCGSQPIWKSKRMDFGTGSFGMEPPMRALNCAAPLCAIQPQTAWRNTQEYTSGAGYHPVDYDSEAIAAWNSRANL